jgi:membrane fusion protein, heavy metal efflux system
MKNNNVINNSFHKLLIFNIIVSFLIACNAPKKEEITDEKQAILDTKTYSKIQVKNMDINYATVQPYVMQEAISVNGMVDVPPENVASVSLPVSGFIQSITHTVLPGKYVAAGTVLATAKSMEFVQIQQEYIEKFVQLDFLMKEYERQKTLSAEDATAKRKFQEADNNLRTNKALVAAYEAKLKIIGADIGKIQKGDIATSLPIRSPISGFVKAVNINSGKNFLPSDILFELIGKQHLHVELKVFEKDVYKIKEGQKVEFNDPRLGGKALGTVFLIGKNFEGESKALNVHVHLTDKTIEQNLIPGQYLAAKIIAAGRSVNALPEASILKEDDKYFVYILENENENDVVFKKIEVTKGITQNGFVEILTPQLIKKVVTKHVIFLNGGGGEEE